MNGSKIIKSDRNFQFPQHESSVISEDILYPELTEALPDGYVNDATFNKFSLQTDPKDVTFTNTSSRLHLIDRNKVNMFSFPPVVSPDSGYLKQDSRLTSVYKI